MKHRLCALFFIFLITFCVSGSANEQSHFIPCPKTYVSPEQIDFCENGIFVQVNDCIIQTETLCSDAQGIFFANARDDGCGPSQWRCVRKDSRGMVCNTCNWDWNYTCSNCGEPKSKSKRKGWNLNGWKSWQSCCWFCFRWAARWFLFSGKHLTVSKH